MTIAFVSVFQTLAGGGACVPGKSDPFIPRRRLAREPLVAIAQYRSATSVLTRDLKERVYVPLRGPLSRNAEFGRGLPVSASLPLDVGVDWSGADVAVGVVFPPAEAVV